MKVFKSIYAIMGLILAAGSILTGEYGLSEVNRDIYQRALSLDEDMQKLGFPQFSLADYKVRFYNGNCDYVVEASQDKIRKEDAVLDVFAGTTLEVEGEYQVLIPTYEKFGALFDLMGAACAVSQGMAEGTMAFTEDSYSENSHGASIWHEAFHAWQSGRFEKEISDLMERVNMGKEETREDVILGEADAKTAAVKDFEEEMEFLQKAWKAEDAQRKEYIVKALALAKEREEMLSDSANAMEFYLENLEGSAMYVESQAYRLLEGDQAWQEYYMGEFQYENGSGKYYHMGMLKGVLLDEISPGWQKDFSMEKGLNELLRRACEG